MTEAVGPISRACGYVAAPLAEALGDDGGVLAVRWQEAADSRSQDVLWDGS